MTFLNVACVKVGARYGADYVNTLFDMVRRNLPAGYAGRFVCFTDDATGLDPAIVVKSVPQELASRGWWAKLYLFSEDAFPKGERVLYFDLDTCITGPLDAIAGCTSWFAILRDAYRPDGLQSSVMAWEAGKTTDVWDLWEDAGRPEVEGGDQAWIEQFGGLDLLQDLFPGQLRSYKVECRYEIPKGTSVVFFHGHPRPHEVIAAWVPEVWKVGGGSGAELFVVSNVPDDTLRTQVTEALNRHCQWLTPVEAHGHTALLVGGGPSLKDNLWMIRGMQLNGCRVFATNNAYEYLKENGIQPDFHVMLDAREANREFVPDDRQPKYYASQCHPSVLDAAGDSLICWHAHHPCYRDHIAHHASADVQVGGGSSVGLRAMALAYVLGYRDLRLFGFDSSYAETHHAYPQKLNDGERLLEITVEGEKFRCAPWMVTQAEEFRDLAVTLLKEGCTLSVYGDGLIPFLFRNLSVSCLLRRAAEIKKRIRDIPQPVGAEIGVFHGSLSQQLLNREDVTLYMVDAWAPYIDRSGEDDFHAKMPLAEHEEIYQTALKQVAFAGERARIIRDWSVQASKAVPDASLDFVFIDAEHSYEGCSADIASWAPKVKPGGWLMGHDYRNPNYPAWGVERAVHEYAYPRGLNVEAGDNYTWFIHLPTESRVH